MGGGCLVVLLLLISPRLFLVGVWFFSNWYEACDSRLVALLGWLFLPCTSLAWMYVFFQNGRRLEGRYLVLLILVVLFDIGAPKELPNPTLLDVNCPPQAGSGILFLCR